MPNVVHSSSPNRSSLPLAYNSRRGSPLDNDTPVDLFLSRLQAHHIVSYATFEPDMNDIRCAVENDRKHDDLCMGAMGYKNSRVTKNKATRLHTWNDLDTPTNEICLCKCAIRSST